MEYLEGLDRLFFELASESRLDILCTLQVHETRMLEIARKLNMTDTEASRQLLRLSDASLIQKNPDGAYAITQYGRLLLQFSRSFEFALKFRDCLIRRDIWRFPEPFINRMGELLQAASLTGTIDTLNCMASLISETEKTLLCIIDRPLHLMNAKAMEKVQQGVAVKVIFEERNLEFYEKIPETKGVLEKKVIDKIPAVLLISEKSAAVNLMSIDSREEAMLFYGKDPKFLNWANDIFSYYWERGKPFRAR